MIDFNDWLEGTYGHLYDRREDVGCEEIETKICEIDCKAYDINDMVYFEVGGFWVAKKNIPALLEMESRDSSPEELEQIKKQLLN